MDSKKQLAIELTAIFYDVEKAKRELQQFEQVFSKKEDPDDMPVVSWDQLGSSDQPPTLLHVLFVSGLFASKGEARRLIQQGAVRIDKERQSDPLHTIAQPVEPIVIQAGKRIFFKVVG